MTSLCSEIDSTPSMQPQATGVKSVVDDTPVKNEKSFINSGTAQHSAMSGLTEEQFADLETANSWEQVMAHIDYICSIHYEYNTDNLLTACTIIMNHTKITGYTINNTPQNIYPLLLQWATTAQEFYKLMDGDDGANIRWEDVCHQL